MGQGDAPEGVALQTIEETDSYTKTVAGATVEAVRVARGTGPNHVIGIPGDAVTVTQSRIGFPILTHSHVAKGRALAAFVNDAPCDSRWCGVPLRRGHVIVYGPGVEHQAVNRPGLRFTFAVTDLDELVELGDRLGSPFDPPRDANVREFQPSAQTADLGAALDAHVTAATGGRALERPGAEVLLAFASLLASPGDEQRMKTSRGVDSREVVHSCIEFVEATGRLPTIDELCLAAHVSERRLRAAFLEEFDQPPSSYFRAWALGEAHRRLRTSDPGDSSVTRVAADLGFDHLGRFSGRYRQLFGETPSATLREPAPTAP